MAESDSIYESADGKALIEDVPGAHMSRTLIVHGQPDAATAQWVKGIVQNQARKGLEVRVRGVEADVRPSLDLGR